jgi:Ran GTPase-activating protein (RanGAP) involved in mRNA processing and transport
LFCFAVIFIDAPQAITMTLSSSSTDPSTAIYVHPEALQGLITLREAGLFKNIDVENQHCADAWRPRVQCDEETGLVIFLDFGGCRLRRGIPDGDGVPEVLTSCQTLNLANTDVPLKAEIVILKEMLLLEALYLGGNGIRDDLCLELARSYLPTAINLKVLDLRYNNIGPAGCQALCEGLVSLLSKSKAKGLHRLYLEGNRIGDAGAVALAKWLAVQGNPLQEIFLGANNIGPEGAAALAECLKTNKTITKIYLEGNSIGPAGADAFTTVLTECKGDTALKHLFCDNNDIGKEGSTRLGMALNSATAIGESLV